MTSAESHESGACALSANGKGPLFCVKEQNLYVKTSASDTSKRAVLNAATMTLVDYADADACRDEELRSDPHLFVPIYCRECYGTKGEEYERALSALSARALSSSSSSSEKDTYLIGVCCVYGGEPDEAYPKSRLAFALDNALSYSGACHPQPGKLAVLHDTAKVIGRVECYWHVHSKSTEKTFVFCCASCDRSATYADQLLEQLTRDDAVSMAFSLGTVGDNAHGPVTEECSFVSVPMRPGCFCVAVTERDALTRTMIRMGFCTNKDAALEAGLGSGCDHDDDHDHDDDDDDDDDNDDGTTKTTTTPSSPAKNTRLRSKAEKERRTSGARSGERGTPGEIVREPSVAEELVNSQAEEILALKDALRVIKIQMGALKLRLSAPRDPDTSFTFRGAKDFAHRTGLRDRLCAGREGERAPSSAPAEGTNAAESVAAGARTSIERAMESGGAVAHGSSDGPLSVREIEEIRRLISNRPPDSAWQARYGSGSREDASRTAPEHRCRSPYAGASEHFDRSKFGGAFQDALTEDQKREIALSYNKREQEKEEAARKKREDMMAMIKDSVGEMIEKGVRAALRDKTYGNDPARDEQGPSEDVDSELKTLARGTPYNRRARPALSKEERERIAVSSLLKELKELREQVHSDDLRPKAGQPTDSGAPMETDEADAGCPQNSGSQENPPPPPPPPPPPSARSAHYVPKKQQAGYRARVPEGNDGTDAVSEKQQYLREFISAVSEPHQV